jgi:S1-C subfamily serine protease
MNQFVPFLRKGIISSVFPFPGPSPHGFTIDVMTQGGESGSPIFRCEDGLVIGVLYAGVDATNITFGIPSSILADTVDQVVSVFDVRFEDLRSWRHAQEPEHQASRTTPPDQESGETA